MGTPDETAQAGLAAFAGQVRRRFPDFFDATRPIWVGRAPGRLDVMGGVADYSGSLVLELPLSRSTFAAVQPRSDRRVRIWSTTAEAEGGQPRVELDLSDLGLPDTPVDYPTFQRQVGANPRTRWVRYVAGGLLVLAKEGLVPHSATGVDIAVASDVPPGAGVSSSAALEVAVLTTLATAWGIRIEPLQLALLAQKVENLAVGAPCGVMDQVTATLGRRDALLALLCQPAQVQDYVQLPEGVFVCGINTGVKHSVAGTRYRDSRVATFMGRKIIWEAVRGESPDGEPFGGYLVNVGVREFRRRFWGLLPTRLPGKTFLERYGETGDPVTRVDPETVYAVRSRTEHAIYEHERVQRFRAWLEKARRGEQLENALVQAGKLMY
ncbi:MAG: GHMP kinase, partial [Calditrichaeota bacterium]|nr:GHMP kinase [Calditrichota bacterium]